MNEAEFLAAIIESPDDDAPRLAYADWLEERGDPRGEFIRVQCQRAKLDDRDPRCVDLEYRERRLLAKHGSVWAKPVRKWSRTLEFQRGFVDQITLSAETFLENGEEILSTSPIRHVKLMRLAKHVEAIAKYPLLVRLGYLNLRDGKLGLARLKTFLASPWLNNLQGLDFSYNGLSVSGVREIVGCKAIEHIKSLCLDSCKLAGEGLDILLKSTLVEGVRELQLRSNNLKDEDIQRLASCPALSELRDLSLEFNRDLTANGIRLLLESKNLRNLQRISLRECSLRLEATEGFLTDIRDHPLVVLNLSNNSIGSEGVRQLAKSPCLKGLVELHLDLNFIGNDGFRALVESENLHIVRALRLHYNQLNAAATKILCNWEGAEHLTHLDLSANSIGDKGVADLASAENLTNLNILDLRFTDMTDSGAAAIAESTTLSRLTELRLSATACDAPYFKVPGFSTDMKKRLTKRFGREVCRFS